MTTSVTPSQGIRSGVSVVSANIAVPQYAHKKLLDPTEKERLRALFDGKTYHYRFSVEGIKEPIAFSFDLREFLRECREFFEERGMPILDIYCKGGSRGYVLGERDDDLADFDLTFEVDYPDPEKWKMVEQIYLAFLCCKSGVACGTDDGSSTITYYRDGKIIGKLGKSDKFRDEKSLFIQGGLKKKFWSEEGFCLFKLPTLLGDKELPLDIDLAASKNRKFIRKNSCTGSDDCVCIKITPVLEKGGENIWEKDIYAYALDGMNIHDALRDARVINVDLAKVMSVHGGFFVHCKKLTEGKIYPFFFDMDKAYFNALVAEYGKKWGVFGKNLKNFIDDHYKNDRVSQALYLLNCVDSVIRHQSDYPEETGIVREVLFQQLLEVLNLNPFQSTNLEEFSICRACLYLFYSPDQFRARGLFHCGEGRDIYILPIKERRALNFDFSQDELGKYLKSIEDYFKLSPLAKALLETFSLKLPAKKTWGAWGAAKAEAHFQKPQPILKSYFNDLESFGAHFPKLRQVSDKRQIEEIQSWLFDLIKREKDNPDLASHQQKISFLLQYHASLSKGKETDKIFLFFLEREDFFTLPQVRAISVSLVSNFLRKGKIEASLRIYSHITEYRWDAGELLKDIVKMILDKKKESCHALMVMDALLIAIAKKNSYFVVQKAHLKECIVRLTKKYEHLDEGFRLVIKHAAEKVVLEMFIDQYECLPSWKRNEGFEMMRKEVSQIDALSKDSTLQAKLNPVEKPLDAVEYKEENPVAAKKNDIQKHKENIENYRNKINCLLKRLKNKKHVHNATNELCTVMDKMRKIWEVFPDPISQKEFHLFLLDKHRALCKLYEQSKVKDIFDFARVLVHLHSVFIDKVEHVNQYYLELLRVHLEFKDWAPYFDTKYWENTCFVLSDTSSARYLVQFCTELSAIKHRRGDYGKLLVEIATDLNDKLTVWSKLHIRRSHDMPHYHLCVEFLRKIHHFLEVNHQKNKAEDEFSQNMLKGVFTTLFYLCQTGGIPVEIEGLVKSLLKFPTSLKTTDLQVKEFFYCLSSYISSRNYVEKIPEIINNIPPCFSAEEFHRMYKEAVGKGNYAKAVRICEIFNDLNPLDPDPYSYAADAYISMKENIMAFSLLQKGVINFPQNSNFYEILGHFHIEESLRIHLRCPKSPEVEYHAKECLKCLLTINAGRDSYPRLLRNLGKVYLLLFKITTDARYLVLAEKHLKERINADHLDYETIRVLQEVYKAMV